MVGLISKLRSKTSVATNAKNMKAEEQPDRFEAADPEENSRDTFEPRADLGSGEVWEVFGVADIEELEEVDGDNFEEESEQTAEEQW